jgi:hypothetical protein
MKTLQKQTLQILQQLKGSGKFTSINTTKFIFPGLNVENVGEIAFPLNKYQAELLIQSAQKAPFGKGSQTIFDDNVRSAREIDASKLTFNNPEWEKLLQEIINEIKIDLGLENYVIDANLYKLLIYEKGDFFLPHKDSEKEKGMFGTLIIGLPSQYRGGELVIKFDGEKETARFDQDNYNINYAAFYADCDHEVKPLISGYRVCLTYNLIQQKAAENIKLQSLQSYASELATLFSEYENNSKPYIVLLGHQYTPENFSKENLKLNDRSKAETLMLAAEKAGFYAKMCLVTSYLSGAPEYEDYYKYGKEDGDENAKMEEVYEEELDIEHWLKNNFPDLNKVHFEEDDLITSFTLDEDEPIIKESTGYMGNYGPDLMHWYHYGAVMIWSPKVNAQILFSQSTKTQLEWINYFIDAPQVSEEEVKAIYSILSTGFNNSSINRNDDVNYNAIANWLIKQNQETFLLKIADEVLQFYFEKIDYTNWIKLLIRLEPKNIQKLFDKLTKNITLPVLEKLTVLILKMAKNESLKELTTEQVAKLPACFKSIYAQTNHMVKATVIDDLFLIEKELFTETSWIKQLTKTLTEQPDWNYIHQVLVPQLLTTQQNTSQLRANLLDFCKEYLKKSIDNQPKSHSDWTRPLPNITNYKKEWGILTEFLSSPDQQVFDYRRNQSERESLEFAIKAVEIDLKTETIRKGSPHTLRIIKTQAEYERLMKKWHEDVALLYKIQV